VFAIVAALGSYLLTTALPASAAVVILGQHAMSIDETRVDLRGCRGEGAQQGP